MKDEKILQNEILSDEDLEKVSGGGSLTPEEEKALQDAIQKFFKEYYERFVPKF